MISLLAVWSAHAQVQPSRPTADRSQVTRSSPSPTDVTAGKTVDHDGKQSDVLVLNPFEVNADKDRGFMATNAGTATKLGLDMKEMSAPYSVMTGEFLQTMGITKIEDAAIWSTNGAPVLDGQGGDTFAANGTGTGRTFQASTMYFARGVITNAGQQRNYFLNLGINDTYDVERVDFGRGPNAVLFNVGASSALGGGYSTVGKRARLDRNFYNYSLTAGSWDYLRATIDANQQINDKLALRLNLMKQGRGGYIENDRDDRYGATLAATWRISEKSELNVEIRDAQLKRTNAPIPMTDNLSGWDGRTVLNGRMTNDQYNGAAALMGTGQTLSTITTTNDAGVASTIAQGRAEGINRLDNYYIYDPVSGTVIDWEGTGVTRRADADLGVPLYGTDGKTYVRYSSMIPSFGAWGASGGGTTPAWNNNPGGSHPSFLDSINLPINYSKQSSAAHFTVPGRRSSNIFSDPIYTETTRGAFLNFTHKISDALIFEAQASVTEVDMKIIQSAFLNARIIGIDINKVLPNGQANPHFLDAYGDVSDVQYSNKLSRDSGARAALAYQKDFGKWGSYTFNLSVLATERVIDQVFYAYSLRTSSTDPRDWHDGANHIRLRYYLNDPQKPFWGLAPTQLYSVTSSGTGNAQAYSASTISINPSFVPTDWGYRNERNVAGIFAFAARYFDNKLIISPGIRYGKQNTYVRNRAQSWANIAPSWNGLSMNEPTLWKPDAPSDWTTMTYVRTGQTASALALSRPYLSTLGGRNDVRPADPAYASARFRDDYNFPRAKTTDLATTFGVTYNVTQWAALKLNYGSAFKPSDVGRFTLDGKQMDSEQGIAYDAGITFSLFNDKLAITPRYYYNRAENIAQGGAGMGSVNDLIQRRKWDDPIVGNWNLHGFGSVWGQDTRSQYNDGYELEITGNPIRGLRISASCGTAQIVDFARNPKSKAYALSRAGDLKTLLEDAGGQLDTAQKPKNNGTDIAYAPGLAVANPAITDAMLNAVVLSDGSFGKAADRTAAVNSYNAVWLALAQNDAQTDGVGLSRATAKLVTDYTFQSGKLKGFRAGFAAFYVQRDRAGFYTGDVIPNPNYNASLVPSTTNSPWVSSSTGNNVWTPRQCYIDGLFGYKFRVHGFGRLDGHDVELQLNVKNLWSKYDVYYQDDGVALRAPNGDLNSVARVSTPSRVAEYSAPVNYELSVSMKF
ncbi:MAG: hypothetical protein ABIZ04_24555 [Opitutus sp.]